MENTCISLGDLQERWDGTALGAALQYSIAQSHDEKLRALRNALDFACNELEVNKHLKTQLSEDQLTIEICSQLRQLGFQATHDEQVGGHCDIVIRGKNRFIWMAEAKKHSDYKWLEKGFMQLSTRYSTGVPGQDHADIIIYCKNKNAASLLETWQGKLCECNPEIRIEQSSRGDPLEFWSTHLHETSGLEFHIRHRAVALYWNPHDK